LAIDLINYD